MKENSQVDNNPNSDAQKANLKSETNAFSSNIKCESGKEKKRNSLPIIGTDDFWVELETTREKFKFQSNIINQIKDAIIVVDNEERVSYLNQAAAEQYDINPDEAIGCKLTELHQYNWLKPEDEQAAYASLAEKGYWSGENIHIKKNGDRIYVESTVSVLKDHSGQNIGMLAVIRDITERRRMEQTLEESEEKYRSLVEQANDGIVIIQDTLLKYVNSRLAEMSGYTVEELIGTPFTDYIHPDDIPKLVDRYKRRMAGENVPAIYEAVVKHKDGSNRHIEFNASIITYEGKPADLVICRDITDERKTKETLAETNQLFETILDSTHMLVAYLDPQFNFVRANRAYAEADEREPSFFPGKNHFDLFPNEENEEIFRRVVETGEPYFVHAKPFEYAEHPERGVTYWDWSLIPTKNSDGVVTGLVLTLADVTERKRAEKKLWESQAELSTIFDNAPILMIVMDEERRVRKVNRAATEFTGRASEEMMNLRGGKAIHCFHSFDDPRGCGFAPACETCTVRRVVLDTFETGKSHRQMEAKLLLACGEKQEERTFLVSTAPLSISENQMVLVCLEDITERKRVEYELEKHRYQLEELVEQRTGELIKTNEQLQEEIEERKKAEEARRAVERELEEQRALSMRTDRLRSLGQMAAGIAHELNQPLVGVRGLAEHTLIGMERGWELTEEKLNDRLTKIIEQADRMSHIIEHVRMFAREAGKPEVQIVQINDVVEAAMGLIGAQFRSRGLELECELAGDLPPVLANPFSLEEVVLNLIINARDAVEEHLEMKGHESLDSSAASPRVLLRTFLEKEYVKIEVIDWGIGIPEEILQNVFDPFFTTKGPNQGTGLGLSISRSIVEQFEGTMDIQSTPNQGTKVTISLPTEQHHYQKKK